MSKKNDTIEAWGELQRLTQSGLSCQAAIAYYDDLINTIKNKSWKPSEAEEAEEVRPSIAYIETTIPVNGSEATGTRQARMLIDLRKESLIPDDELTLFLTILHNYHVRLMDKIMARQAELNEFLRKTDGASTALPV